MCRTILFQVTVKSAIIVGSEASILQHAVGCKLHSRLESTLILLFYRETKIWSQKTPNVSEHNIKTQNQRYDHRRWWRCQTIIYGRVAVGAQTL